LVGLYQQGFADNGLVTAQLLMTEEDFGERHRYLDLRATLERLLEAKVVPILNENDAVTHGAHPAPSTRSERAVARRVFSDNDRLAALVAAKCHADLLVLLTDVDGVYDRNPRTDPEALLLERIEDPGAVLAGIDDVPGSSVSRGGMHSKVEAARIAARGGCHVVIACGRRSGVLEQVASGVAEGTFFPALGTLPARRRWIAYAAAARGVLHLDAGAVRALRERRASLLPVGVAAVEGRFDRGDVVELRGPEGDLVGRGLMSYDADEARRWCAGYPPSSADGRQPNCLLRRTHVVLEN
jgi:glutamate 5-kinase